jgi:hypothetical protein
MLARLGTWVMLVVGVGCAAPVEQSPASGYVLLDREARAKGTLTVGGWRGAPALPISAEEGDSVLYHSAGETRSIEPQSQMLAYVRGSSGRIDWIRLGADARPDSLVLEGDAVAASTLAKTVGGTSAEVAVGRQRISVSDAYFKLAFSKEPDGLAEAFPDFLEGKSSPFAASATDGRFVEQAARAARGAADFVGLYLHEGRLLVLDASGNYTLDPNCAGEDKPTGRYREDAGRIVLEGAAGTTTLSADGDDLVEASGRRFALMKIEAPARTPNPLMRILEEEE